MSRLLILTSTLLALLVLGVVTGCGGGSGGGASPGAAGQNSGSGTNPSSEGDGLTAEAQQEAAGDIPDNQVFLVFHNAAGGYSMRYPEGWAKRGAGERVTFQDKNNLVRVEVLDGGEASVAGATADMNGLRQQSPSLSFEAPTNVTVSGKPMVKVVYSTESAPNPVTGKRVTLVVDRYYVPGTGKHAIVDLGTPQGVDNVDAYRLMIESFQWN